jgi:hypothetical protein
VAKAEQLIRTQMFAIGITMKTRTNARGSAVRQDGRKTGQEKGRVYGAPGQSTFDIGR